MYVRGVVVKQRMGHLASEDLALNGIEKADEFDMSVALHAATNHAAVEHRQDVGATRCEVFLSMCMTANRSLGAF
jgi:hypothetical protein